MQSAIEDIQPFTKVEVETAEERQLRIDEIDKDLGSAKTRRELEREDNDNDNEYRKKKMNARIDSAKRFASTRSLSQFKLDFYNAIADQVTEIEDEEDTYSRFNRQYEEDPALIVKGQRTTDLPNDEIPTVDVYLDCSGSFSAEDIDMEKALVSSIQPFVDEGKVVLNIYYFGQHMYNTYEQARGDGDNGAIKEIIDNINSAPKTKNVVFVSDSDEEYYLNWATSHGLNYARNQYPNWSDVKRTYIDGHVWWIWKRNQCSKRFTDLIVGGTGNNQYKF